MMASIAAAWSTFFDAWEAKYDKKEHQQNHLQSDIEIKSAELADSVIEKAVCELKHSSQRPTSTTRQRTIELYEKNSQSAFWTIPLVFLHLYEQGVVISSD